jgi:hypothetical protein
MTGDASAALWGFLDLLRELRRAHLVRLHPPGGLLHDIERGPGVRHRPHRDSFPRSSP